MGEKNHSFNFSGRMLSLANKEFKVKLCDNEGWLAHLMKLSHFTFVSRRPPRRGHGSSILEQYLPTTGFQAQLKA